MINTVPIAAAVAENRPFVEQRVEISGHFRIEKGRRNPVTGAKEINASYEFDNLITNQGLDFLGGTGGSDFLLYCHVGTDTTPEAVGDTALGAFLASKSVSGDVSETYRSVNGAAPYFSTYHLKYEFGEGEAAGIIAEIGISNQATTGGLFSRALVKDGASPLGTTTITVLADEYLDVYYQLRMYPDHTGSPHGSGTIPIDNASPRTTTTYEIAAAHATTYAYMAGVGRAAGYFLNGTAYGVMYGPSASLGPVTSGPTGAADSDGMATGNSSAVNSTYTPGSYYRDITWTAGLSAGNVVGSPQGFNVLLVQTTMGAYQIKFGDLVPKDSTKIFTFTLRLAWARKTL